MKKLNEILTKLFQDWNPTSDWGKDKEPAPRSVFTCRRCHALAVTHWCVAGAQWMECGVCGNGRPSWRKAK